MGTLPLGRRKLDLALIGFFALNLFFITYMVDLEQLVVADPARFEYPLWPPGAVIDLVHWWGRTYDPLLLARPPFWRATIWIDVIGFGPFYAAALYAFVKGREWIRVPAFVWAGLMVANVTILMFEELNGAHPPPQPAMVLFANASWFLFPFVVVARLWRERPFTQGTA